MNEGKLNSRQRALRLSLAAADAAIQAAQAAVRAAHAIAADGPGEQPPATGCQKCGSQDLRKAQAMGETQVICGACEHIQEG